jgi:predicted nucleotidyltransferase
MDILFGAYRQRVLSLLLLNPDTDYHVRELARLTETNAGTLHKELARLAAAGLLLRKAQGNQVRYQANRDSPVFPELAGLFRKTTGLVSVIADALQPLKPRLALIFGSIARGEETAASDIDLLLIGDFGFADAVKAMYPLQTRLQREISPVVYNPVEFKSKIESGDRFVREVLAKPKLFVVGTADDLGKLAGDTPAAAV